MTREDMNSVIDEVEDDYSENGLKKVAMNM
jgi:hypothetical protein